MHNTYYFYDTAGNITKSISCDEEEAQLQTDEVSIGYITFPSFRIGNIFRDYKVVDGELVLRPENERILNGYLEDKIAQVTDNKIIQEYLPITVDNITVDADEKARSNISLKLREIEMKLSINQVIPETYLVWKDADNQLHTWNDAEIYKTWLQNVFIAIAERTTQLYQELWTKKETLSNMTSLDEVLNFE